MYTIQTIFHVRFNYFDCCYIQHLFNIKFHDCYFKLEVYELHGVEGGEWYHMCHGFITQMAPFLCTQNLHFHHVRTYKTSPWLVPNPCVEVAITDFDKAIDFIHTWFTVEWRGFNWVVALTRRDTGSCAIHVQAPLLVLSLSDWKG